MGKSFNSIQAYNRDYAKDHFLVVVEPDADRQYALEQALNCVNAFKLHHREVKITALMSGAVIYGEDASKNE